MKTKEQLWTTAVKNCEANDMNNIVKTFFKLAKEEGMQEKECREFAYEIIEANVNYLQSTGRKQEAFQLAIIGAKTL